MSSNARKHSSNVVSYTYVSGEPQPIYGCGKTKEELKDYEVKRAKQLGQCIDWLYNRCVYNCDECKFKHELPPRKVDAEEAKQRKVDAEEAKLAEMRKKWNEKMERLREREAAKRARKPTVTWSRPHSQTNDCTGDDSSNGIQEPSPRSIPGSLQVPQLPYKTVYQPMTFEPAPVPTVFDSYTAEYTPSYSYAPSYSGSMTSEMSQTSAPSIQHPVAMPVPLVYPVGLPAGYQTVPYVRHDAVIAIQEMNAQLAAEVEALKKSEEQTRLMYSTELAKFKQERALETLIHGRALQKAEAELMRMRLDYERQLEQLREEKRQALKAAEDNEQRALKSEARLKELEGHKEEVVVEASMVAQCEEVVRPKEANTYFTTPAVDSLLPTIQEVEENPVARPQAVARDWVEICKKNIVPSNPQNGHVKRSPTKPPLSRRQAPRQQLQDLTGQTGGARPQ